MLLHSDTNLVTRTTDGQITELLDMPQLARLAHGKKGTSLQALLKLVAVASQEIGRPKKADASCAGG
jgi:hypothetical protein